MMVSKSQKPKAAKQVSRCKWVSTNELYISYHDDEWGVPVYDDRKHFEFLILEGAQAGLSWLTVLKKREGYRRCFANFDAKKVAKFGETDIQRILKDEGVVRNKLKVRAAVTNAQNFLLVQKEFGSFNDYIWGFVGGRSIDNKIGVHSRVPATSPESDLLSKDLKKRGFKFVGSTIIYAHMQACGLVNDHLTTCFRYKKCK